MWVQPREVHIAITDGLLPIWRQAIGNLDGDIGWLISVKSTRQKYRTMYITSWQVRD